MKRIRRLRVRTMKSRAIARLFYARVVAYKGGSIKINIVYVWVYKQIVLTLKHVNIRWLNERVLLRLWGRVSAPIEQQQ